LSQPALSTCTDFPDVVHFSHTVLGRPLYRYQARIIRAIAQAALLGQGETLTVMLARQMGKNELSAQLEAYLLNLRAVTGGTIVKAAPTLKPQSFVSRQRLLEVLGNRRNNRKPRTSGDAVELGHARVRFLSGAPHSNVVGATADLLLELDEAQDLDADKIQHDFRPMASTTNATIVLYGTAWDTSNPLERQKQLNLELERHDNKKRHFECDWRELARISPAYRAFVQAEIARLGADHPLIRTQYALQPFDDAGRLLSTTARTFLFSGKHAWLEGGLADDTYIAGVDIAGQDTAALPGLLAPSSTRPDRDSTVVTIARLLRTADSEPEVEIVHHAAWSGADFPTQHQALHHLLGELFPCTRIAVDATGLGAGIASWLANALGSSVVNSFVFTAPSKSRLGFTLLAMAGTGRCRLYQHDDAGHWLRLKHESEAARYELGANEQMRFFVPPNAGHDDYLMSLALCCHAATNAAAPPTSAIIRPRDMPYERW